MANGFEAFEDGTPNYTSLPAIEIGLDFLDRLDIEAVHRRVACLSAWLLERMTALRHDTGRALARIYGPGEAEDLTRDVDDGKLGGDHDSLIALRERDVGFPHDLRLVFQNRAIVLGEFVGGLPVE